MWLGLGSADSCGGVELCGDVLRNTVRLPFSHRARCRGRTHRRGLQRARCLTSAGWVPSPARKESRRTWFRRLAEGRVEPGRTRPNQASASCLWDPACSPGRSDRRSEGAGCFRGCCRIPSRGKKRVSLHSSQMLCRSRLPEPRRCGGGAPLAGLWPRVRRRRSGGKPVVRHRVF